MSEHGHCPKCGVDLDGGSIWQTGLEFALQGKHYEQHGVPARSKHEAERRADEYAEAYGATRTHGQWGRALAVYNMETDRTEKYICPDCKHEWSR
jgi:hypothetical protein